jgi:lipopolysaccharide biosynthesis regulator YciM
MDHLRLAEVNARLDRARVEYTKALTAEREAGRPLVTDDRVKLAALEYDQAIDAFIKFIVKEHDAPAVAEVS